MSQEQNHFKAPEHSALIAPGEACFPKYPV